MIYSHHKFNNLNIVFTDRLDGYSQDNADADYASLNLGFHVGDDYDTVQKNYSVVLDKLAISARPVSIAKQVHGIGLLQAPRIAGNITKFNWDSAAEADIISLDDSDNAVSVMLFADCLPLVLFDNNQNRVISIHVGWKGLVSDIVSEGLSQLDNLQNITAVLGPSIDSCCYEVNENIASSVRKLFPDKSNLENIIIETDNKYFLSIKSAVIKQLQERGVGKIINDSPCTACNDRFYSHRKSSQANKVSGRQASIVYFEV
jgi:YfiH family protein